MKVSVLGFGIVREIFGNPSICADVPENATIGDLRGLLEHQYPRLTQLASYMVAQNNRYAEAADFLLLENEIAIIPPVSGG